MREERFPDETPEESCFRAEVRKWLESSGLPEAQLGGTVSPWAELTEEGLAQACQFQRALSDAGPGNGKWTAAENGKMFCR